jgi:prolipoprotein diacylglyceryltransferase
VVLYLVWKKYNKKVQPGFFFGLFFVLYFAMRFTVEFFKEYPLHGGLTTGQWLSIPFFLLGLGVLIWTQKKK